MYLTIETKIEHGNIIALEPARLPESGRGLLTIVQEGARKPDWKRVCSYLGGFTPKEDPAEWQKKIRG